VALVVTVAIVGTAASVILPRATSFPLPVAIANVSLPGGVPYVQLTTGAWNDRWPAWSPSGSLIAYVSDRGGGSALWIMSSGGSHAYQASASSEATAYPSWNPSSNMVAYWTMNGEESEIRLFRTADNHTVIVPGSGPFAVQARAAWSPDGSLLAFFSNVGTPQLMVYNLESGSSSAVARVNGSMLSVGWESSDRLVYSSTGGGYNEIEWLSLSTNQTGVVTSGEANFVAPSVGPNGTLAYFSDLTIVADSMFLQGLGGYVVWVSNADGSNATFPSLTVLTAEGEPFDFTVVPIVPGFPDLTSPPAWSPEGGRLAYTASSSLFSALYVWDISNSNVRAVSPLQAGVMVSQPSWSPAGNSIAFSCNSSGTYHIWVTSTSGTATPLFTGY
jgi:Tol biopolymer transport system component